MPAPEKPDGTLGHCEQILDLLQSIADLVSVEFAGKDIQNEFDAPADDLLASKELLIKDIDQIKIV